MPASAWALLEEEDAQARWACIDALVAGDPDAAIEAVLSQRVRAERMPHKLYLLARAQLMLAEASGVSGASGESGGSGGRDAYLDAGLTFMRIVIHYADAELDLIPAARLEVAYIHRVIGREDLYQKLLFDSGLSLCFADDPETYPQYHRRYYEIIGEPLPGATPEDGDE